MTKVIGINCHKWLKIIGIVLWSGATIGLGIGEYVAYIYAFVGVAYFPDDVCKMKEYMNDSNCSKMEDQRWLVLSSIVNIGNIIGMWLVINDKYKFFELKCTSGSLLND